MHKMPAPRSPRGLTISEKILAAHSGAQCLAGESLVCRIDSAMATDGSAPMAIDYFRKMGGTALREPERIVFAMDHYAPPDNPATVRLQDVLRDFSESQGNVLYEIGAGIGHQLMVERGHVMPGALVLGADSHAVTYGALNAFAAGIGSSDMAAVMLTGKLWLKVPETIRVVLTGHLPACVDTKDVALEVIRRIDPDFASYKALEFSGDGVASLTLEQRMVLANMSAEAGAKAGVFEADDRTYEYLRRQAGRDIPESSVRADPDAVYAGVEEIDLSALAPRLALPPRNGAAAEIVALEKFQGTRVDMVYLGTCTGGRSSDFEKALAVIRRGGKKHPRVQLVVTPASDRILSGLGASGMLNEFIQLGAIIMTPGCGACCGTCGGIPGDGKVVLSAANRNFTGRMGNARADIYLASPEACAAAALTGVITDPRAINGASASAVS
jgi:3-isopropylmalate/(R)-2-methylmalate dehydratase large subunit